MLRNPVRVSTLRPSLTRRLEDFNETMAHLFQLASFNSEAANIYFPNEHIWDLDYSFGFWVFFFLKTFYISLATCG